MDNLAKHLDPKPIVIAEPRLASLAIIVKRRFGIGSCVV